MKVSGLSYSSFFERLICKAVSWSQQTSKTFDGFFISEIFKDVAIAVWKAAIPADACQGV